MCDIHTLFMYTILYTVSTVIRIRTSGGTDRDTTSPRDQFTIMHLAQLLCLELLQARDALLIHNPRSLIQYVFI